MNKLKDILYDFDNDYYDKLKISPIINEWKMNDGKEINLKYILSKPIKSIYGKEFYEIANALNINIDTLSKTAFSQIERTKQTLSKIQDKNLNRFQKFVKEHLFEQRDFALKAGIDPTRLSKILNGDRNDFYAFEVHFMAKSVKIKSSNAFHELYK